MSISECQKKMKERKMGLKGYLARDGLKTRNTYKDFSRRNPTVIRVLNRFRYVNRISRRVSLPHPINIKGQG